MSVKRAKIGNRNLLRKTKIRTKYSSSAIRKGRVDYRKTKDALEGEPLQDMIAASRIVAAQRDGIAFDVEFVSENARKIATRIIAPKRTGVDTREMSSQQLNRAIVNRNRIENKPTDKTKVIYKQLMSEE